MTLMSSKMLPRQADANSPAGQRAFIDLDQADKAVA